MELTIDTKIYYSNKEMVPLSEVANSLLALEQMAKYAGSIAEGMEDGLKLTNIRVFINKIESGSISEEVIFKMVAEVQGKLQDKLESFGKSKSVDFIKNNKSILSWSLLALAVFGGSYAYTALNPSQNNPTIENQINIVLNAGHDITGIDPVQLKKIIESAIREKKGHVAKESVRFIKPAKADPKASITIGEGFEIPAEVARAIPSAYYEDASEDPTILDFERTEIQIRATDLDSAKRGWAAIVPAYGERRVKLHIAPGIALHRIVSGRTITGDVTISYLTNEDGNTQSLQGYLSRVYWPEDED